VQNIVCFSSPFLKNPIYLAKEMPGNDHNPVIHIIILRKNDSTLVEYKNMSTFVE